MCRLAAFPPHFPQDKALEILLEMEGGNTDGVGSAHLNADGEFVVQKWPTSLSKLIEKPTPFLQHMAGDGHNGWTITHLRAKSHGEVAMKNTHPFVIDNKWAFCHNGVWGDYDVVKLALSKTVKFEGETDTEVAGHLFNIAGAKAFCDTIDTAGVFLALRKDGALYIVKTSGSLEFTELDNGKILGASDLKRVEWNKAECVQAGWYYFKKDGTLQKSGRKTSYFSTGHSYPYTGYNSSTAGDKWLPAAFKDKDKDKDEKTITAGYESLYEE
jgi:predicted glutamine amidotransferase